MRLVELVDVGVTAPTVTPPVAIVVANVAEIVADAAAATDRATRALEGADAAVAPLEHLHTIAVAADVDAVVDADVGARAAAGDVDIPAVGEVGEDLALAEEEGGANLELEAKETEAKEEEALVVLLRVGLADSEGGSIGVGVGAGVGVTRLDDLVTPPPAVVAPAPARVVAVVAVAAAVDLPAVADGTLDATEWADTAAGEVEHLDTAGVAAGVAAVADANIGAAATALDVDVAAVGDVASPAAWAEEDGLADPDLEAEQAKELEEEALLVLLAACDFVAALGLALRELELLGHTALLRPPLAVLASLAQPRALVVRVSLGGVAGAQDDGRNGAVRELEELDAVVVLADVLGTVEADGRADILADLDVAKVGVTTGLGPVVAANAAGQVAERDLAPRVAARVFAPLAEVVVDGDVLGLARSVRERGHGAVRELEELDALLVLADIHRLAVDTEVLAQTEVVDRDVARVRLSVGGGEEATKADVAGLELGGGGDGNSRRRSSRGGKERCGEHCS
ncbi:hypothetical protein CC85DRAFT_120698 [Cutaneotrichosporon oleaginosum]|uniref:Uncharacterized protein n=1 Tax=Cutaneotrichosporon oleaginosum TaxID=879819 RepID=A0A0J0XKE1_9TREE|nr:uncharacterized protein CC85DRAFT_120698 [Cutaneotrichosporon oleaginosum]KLT41532.1 hypothetical protein CC85DRAFT_120698 [Cutaneotrichosporon oleaginosum]TXT05819.1 hypothetical protein COLE_07139 [Cutaneotrichosporon oleaginosum]